MNLRFGFRRRALLLLLLGVTVAVPARNLDMEPHTAIMATDFRLRSLEGRFYRLEELRRQGPVALLFVSVDCLFCKAELPNYKALYRQYREQGLHMLAIHVADESVETLNEYVRQHAIEYPVLGNRQHNRAVVRSYGVMSTPTLVLINTEGAIVYRGHRSAELAQHLPALFD